MRRRRRLRIVPPPYPGPVVHGGIVVGVSEEDTEGVPLPPRGHFVIPDDAPPDVVALLREAWGLPPLPAPEPPPG